MRVGIRINTEDPPAISGTAVIVQPFLRGAYPTSSIPTPLMIGAADWRRAEKGQRLAC